MPINTVGSRIIQHSDAPATVARVRGYAIEEILAEKTRAMSELIGLRSCER